MIFVFIAINFNIIKVQTLVLKFAKKDLRLEVVSMEDALFMIKHFVDDAV